MSHSHVMRSLAVVVATAALTVGGLMAPAHAAPTDLPTTYTAPPAPEGTLTDLGSPMSSLTVVEGAFGWMDGQWVAYAAPMGENAQLNVSTTTGTPVQLGRYTMPGASGNPSIVTAPDQKVYLGTYYEGQLFQFDPATKTMTDLGKPTPAATYLYGLSAAPDGTIYGGTYPDAHVFSYKPGTGFTDLGKISNDPAIQYVRSTAYDPEHNALYVGTQPVAKLFRLDLSTKDITEIPLTPPPVTVTTLSDMDVTGGHLFINVNNYLRVVNTTTNTQVNVTDGDTGKITTTYPLNARGVSEARKGGVYFSINYNGVTMVRYDLATDTVKRTATRSTRGAIIGYGWTVENGHDVLYGFAGNYSGGGFRWDIDAGTSGSMQLAITPTPSPLQHVLPSADGSSVFVNAFLNGNSVRYDVASGTATPITRLGQVEDWTLFGETIQAGTYPNGALVSIPTSAIGTTPLTTYTSLKETAQQIRPIEAQVHDGKIWYGTAPDYGLRGGAIVILDPTTGALDINRNVVPDHTIASLAFLGNAVYVGSSTEGGTGTTPVPGSGKLVQWDPVTKQIVRSIVPVEGAGDVNALAIHNGHIYGLADDTVFEVDPVSFTVIRTLKLGATGGFAASTGELVFHPNGYLYANAGHSIYVIDPLAFVATRVTEDTTNRLALSPDGSFWTLIRTEGFTNFLELGRYTPKATDCPNPDTRDYVTLFGQTTTVRNRFLTTGCTLQDLFPLKADGRKSYAGTVNPWLDRLVDQGTITKAERDALWQAAKAGR